MTAAPQTLTRSSLLYTSRLKNISGFCQGLRLWKDLNRTLLALAEALSLYTGIEGLSICIANNFGLQERFLGFTA